MAPPPHAAVLALVTALVVVHVGALPQLPDLEKLLPANLASKAAKHKNHTLAVLGTALRNADYTASVDLAAKLGIKLLPDVELVRVPLNTLLAGASPTGDLTCYSDPGTGLVVGWAQGGVTACSAAGTPTVVPTSTGTVTGLKASLTKNGDLARLIFEITPTSSPYPVYYYCGTALGTPPRELLPVRFGLAGLAGACGTATGRRRLTAAGAVDPAQTLVVAAPLDPLQGPPKAGVKLVYTLAELQALLATWRGAPPPPTAPAPRRWGFGNTGLDAYAVAYGNLGMTLLAQLVEDPGTISVSRDGGATFTAYHSPFTDGIAQSDAWTGALAMSENGVHMYAAYNPWLNATGGKDVLADIYNDGGLLASHDSGSTFQRVVIPTLGGSSIRQFTAVSCSADGRTVVAVATELSGQYVDYEASNPAFSAWGYAQGTVGNTVSVYASTDAGTTWVRSPVGGYVQGSSSSWLMSDYVTAPLQVANNGSYMYLLQTGVTGAYNASTGQVLVGVFDDTRLVYSTNGGSTWTSAYNSNQRAWLDFAVGGPDGNVVAAIWNDNADNCYMVLSTDYGQNFDYLDVGLPASEYVNNIVVDATGQILAVGTTSAILVSTDQGKNWSTADVPSDDWLLVAVEAGGSGTVGSFIGYDSTGKLWAPYGPGTAVVGQPISQPPMASAVVAAPAPAFAGAVSANAATAAPSALAAPRYAPSSAAAVRAVSPLGDERLQPTSVVTGVKIKHQSAQAMRTVLDKRLQQTLTAANATADPAARRRLLQAAGGLVRSYECWDWGGCAYLLGTDQVAAGSTISAACSSALTSKNLQESPPTGDELVALLLGPAAAGLGAQSVYWPYAACANLTRLTANLPTAVDYEASPPYSGDVGPINALYAQLFGSSPIKSKFYTWNPNPVGLRLPPGAAPVYNAFASLGFGTKTVTFRQATPAVVSSAATSTPVPLTDDAIASCPDGEICPPCSDSDSCFQTTSGSGFALPASTPDVSPNVQVAAPKDTPAPVIKPNVANLAQNAPTLIITGTGFDPVGNNTVVLNLDAVGSISSATATQLVVTLTTPPSSTGMLTAVVTSFDGTSATAQVATIVPPPAVTQSAVTVASSAPTLIVAGTDFDPTPAGNIVQLSSGTATVVSATATQLTLALTAAPSVGALSVVITSFGGASGAPVQVATIVPAPVVNQDGGLLASSAPTVVIAGANFDPTPAGNTVQLSSGNATVSSATSTQLTLTFTTAPSAGNLTAVITSFGGPSGAPVQVATIVVVSVAQNVVNRAQNAPTLVITGTGFDPANAVVQLSSGVAAVASATSTQITLNLTTAPNLGNLTAVVTSYNGTSGAPVQVATIVPPPAATQSLANLASSAPTFVIAGTNFDPTPAGNTVQLSSGNATVSSATSTQLTLTFTAPPSAGALTAVLVSNGGTSGAPVQVANVVLVSVAQNSATVASSAPTLVIAGTGFDPSNTTVRLSSGVAAIASASSTQITLNLTSPPSAGNLTATITSYGGTSGAPVQVANIVVVSVAQNLAKRAQNAPTLVITGSGFDPSGAAVQLSSGAATISSATSTQITLTLTTAPNVGPLIAVVLSYAGTSGAPVQVANIVPAPTVTTNAANRAQNAPTLVITGTGFDATPGGNAVLLSSGAATIASASATQLTLTLTAPPSAGVLSAVITSYGGASGAPVQVATIVVVSVAPNGASRARNVPTLVITGTGFDPSGAAVQLSSGAATVSSATSTQITLALTTAPNLGPLNAVVSSYAGTSGAPVQVANIVPAPTVTTNAANRAQNAPTLVITGTGFNPTAGGNAVQLSSGAATIASATTTQLTLTLTAPPSAGALSAVVTSYGGASGAPVQVATIVVVSVAPNLASRAQNAPTIVVTGSGFDPSGAAVQLSSGAATISSITWTQITLTLTMTPNVGPLNVVVSSLGGTSGAPVPVANIVPPPTIAPNGVTLASSAQTYVFGGANFNPVPSGNTLQLSSGAAVITAATPNQLTYAFTSRPRPGALTGVVTSYGGTSGAPVLLANIVDVLVEQRYTNQAINAPTLVVYGTGFNPYNIGSMAIFFNSGVVGRIVGASPTQLQVAMLSPPTSYGILTAVVFSYGGYSNSGVYVPVANIVPPPLVTPNPANLTSNAQTLVIYGNYFDPTPGGTTVQLSSGAGVIVGMSPWQLTLALTAPPSLGPLGAVVSAYGGTSGAPVQVATVVSPTYAFITNRASGTVSSCQVSGTSFTQCSTAASGFSAPTGIAIAGGYAFVTNYNADNTIAVCMVSGARLLYCVPISLSAFTSRTNPVGVAAFATGSGYIDLYVSNLAPYSDNIGVTRCRWAPTAGIPGTPGTFYSCQYFNSPTPYIIFGIAYGGSSLFMTYPNNNLLNSCAVNDNGFYCQYAGFNPSPVPNPAGLAVSPGVNFLYVAGSDGVAGCQLIPSGSVPPIPFVRNCVRTGSSFSNPYGVAVRGNFVYVTNVGSNTVTACTASGSTLTNCVTAASGPFQTPLGIALSP